MNRLASALLLVLASYASALGQSTLSPETLWWPKAERTSGNATGLLYTPELLAALVAGKPEAAIPASIARAPKLKSVTWESGHAGHCLEGGMGIDQPPISGILLLPSRCGGVGRVGFGSSAPTRRFFGPLRTSSAALSSTARAALEKLGTHSLFPNAERAPDDDELANVIRGMIGHQQNGTQVSLIAFPGRNRRRKVIHIAQAPSSARVSA